VEVAVAAGDGLVTCGEVLLEGVDHGCEHGGGEDGAEEAGDKAEDADVSFESLEGRD